MLCLRADDAVTFCGREMFTLVAPLLMDSPRRTAKSVVRKPTSTGWPSLTVRPVNPIPSSVLPFMLRRFTSTPNDDDSTVWGNKRCADASAL